MLITRLKLESYIFFFGCTKVVLGDRLRPDAGHFLILSVCLEARSVSSFINTFVADLCEWSHLASPGIQMHFCQRLG